MGSNANALVVATLHDDEINLVNNTAASVSPSGGSTHQEGYRRRGVLFDVSGADGVGDEVDFALTPFDVEAVTLACVFTPQQDFNGVDGTTDYWLFSLQVDETNEYVRALLDYDSGIDGVDAEVRNSTISDLTLNGLELSSGNKHALALTLSRDAVSNDRTLGIWIDGRLQRAVEYNDTDLPTGANKLRVGTANGATPSRPAKSVIEDVLCYRAALDGDAIWSLYRDGLKTACVDDPTIYESQKRVSGYARSATPGGVVVKWLDSDTSRLWGFAKANPDALLYSDDNAATWNTFHDFNNGEVIRSVWTWNGKVYVSYSGSIDESDKTVAGFTQSIALAGPDSAVFSWGVAISPDEEVLFVVEYEDQPATAANRVLGISKSVPVWASAKGLVGSEEHWHGAFFTRNGDLYVTVGDTESRVYRSSNLGSSWETVIDDGPAPLSEEQVIQGVELTDGRILFASDATTSRALLGVYEPNAVGHAWDGVNRQWSRLGPVTGRLLANVFALYRSTNGTVWIYANREGNAGRHSSIWVMDEDGRAPVLVEDLGEDTTITLGHNFVEHGGWIYLDAYRFPAGVHVTTQPVTEGSDLNATLDVAKATQASVQTLLNRTAGGLAVTYRNFEADGQTLTLNQGEDYKVANGNPIDIDITDPRLTTLILTDGTVPELKLGPTGSGSTVSILGTITAFDDTTKTASVRFEMDQSVSEALTAGNRAYMHDIDFRIAGDAARALTSVIASPVNVRKQVV